MTIAFIFLAVVVFFVIVSLYGIVSRVNKMEQDLDESTTYNVALFYSNIDELNKRIDRINTKLGLKTSEWGIVEDTSNGNMKPGARPTINERLTGIEKILGVKFSEVTEKTRGYVKCCTPNVEVKKSSKNNK